jgi:hypothetical protein
MRLGVILSRASPIDVDVLFRLIEPATDGAEGPPLLLDIAFSRKELAEDEFLDMLKEIELAGPNGLVGLPSRVGVRSLRLLSDMVSIPVPRLVRLLPNRLGAMLEAPEGVDELRNGCGNHS